MASVLVSVRPRARRPGRLHGHRGDALRWRALSRGRQIPARRPGWGRLAPRSNRPLPARHRLALRGPGRGAAAREECVSSGARRPAGAVGRGNPVRPSSGRPRRLGIPGRPGPRARQPAHRTRCGTRAQLDPLARPGPLPPGPPVRRRNRTWARGRRGRLLPHRTGHRRPVAFLCGPNRPLSPPCGPAQPSVRAGCPRGASHPRRGP